MATEINSKAKMIISNDTPIEFPSEDVFGLDPFARAVAASIASMDAPNGLVLAVNGSWGSGKSSAINLIRHHIAPAVEGGDLVPVTFNPWWFSGDDGLTLAFFQELSIAIGPSLPNRLKKTLSSVGQRVSAVGPLIAAAANLKLPGVGGLVRSFSGLIGRWSRVTRTVESEHEALSEALAAQKKKFLVVIDDIDRLSTDDALTMFRLVKSVGRLPNVIYLLAFDRELAERAIAQRFPAEGPSYLEKIVQSAFDVPPPLLDVLRDQLLSGAAAIMGQPREAQIVRFMNVFLDVVAPLLRTPRDVVRLLNALKTTWPPVAGEVDRADFLAIAALRLNQPEIYGAIRDNPDELCGVNKREQQRGDSIKQHYDKLLRIDQMPEVKRESWRRASRRLFPRLDYVWSNTLYSDDGEWQRDRRLCSRQHFPTYFAFALSDDLMPAGEIGEFMSRADDEAFVTVELRKNLGKIRRNGSTRVALLLEELIIRAAEMDSAKIALFVSTLFKLADEIDVPSDAKRGFDFGDNPLRLHWLLNRLVHERFGEGEREAIYRPAMAMAALAWTCDFGARCFRPYAPRSDKDKEERSPPIVSEGVAGEFRTLALDKLRAAASDGCLLEHQRFASLIFEWSRFSEEGVAEVRRWTDRQIGDSQFIVRMAEAMTSVGWVQGLGYDGMGDRVAQRNVQATPDVFEEVLDVEKFETSVRELLSNPDLDANKRQILSTYINAPRRKPRAENSD